MSEPPTKPRRGGRLLAWLAASLVGLPAVTVALLLLGLNTVVGQRFAGSLVARLTHGQVIVSGLHGRVPDRLRLRALTLTDARGTWLTARDIALDWSPLSLLGGVVSVQQLSAQNLTVLRTPAPAATKPQNPKPSGSGIGVGIVARQISVPDLVLGSGVTGVAARFSLGGAARWDGNTTGNARLVLRRLDAPGNYQAEARLTAKAIRARLRLKEPPGGWLARIAHLPPDEGALTADIGLTGPNSAVGLDGDVRWGGLDLTLSGNLNVSAKTDAIALQARSGRMHLAAASWQALAAQARVSGSWTHPRAKLTAHISQLTAPSTSVGGLAIDATLSGQAATLNAVASGVKLPGPKPDLLAAAPARLRATLALTDPTQTLHFTLDHPLLAASGKVALAPKLAARVRLDVPHIGPLAAAFGKAAQGTAQFDAELHETGPSQDRADLTGTLTLTGGADMPAATTGVTHLIVSAVRDGANLPRVRLDLAMPAIRLTANGAYQNGAMRADWQLAAADLQRLAPTLRGAVRATGTVSGTLGAIAARLDAHGQVGTEKFPPGPAELAVTLTGLPATPAGTLSARATLYGAPLTADLHLSRAAEATRLTIDQLHWKSLRADGTMNLPTPSSRPAGEISLNLPRLADLRPLLGVALSGALNARLAATPDKMQLSASVNGVEAPGAGALHEARLLATITGEGSARHVQAQFTAKGIATPQLDADATLSAAGSLAAPDFRLRASLRPRQGPRSQIQTKFTLHPAQHQVVLSAFTASAGATRLSLTQPARLDFGPTLKITGLRAELRDPHLPPARLAADATLRPGLDLTAKLDGLTAAHLRGFVKLPPASFTVSATARLHGTLTHPSGHAQLNLHNLRLPHDGGMPAAEVTTAAELNGSNATLTASAKAGARLHVAVNGTVPLQPEGSLALQADGRLDLGLFNSLAEGRGLALQGVADLQGRITGTPKAPLVSGTFDLRGGDFQDFVHGVHLADISLDLTGDGQSLQIRQFHAGAGHGTITAQGTVGIGLGAPISLHLTADHARLLDSDLARLVTGADLRVAGALGQSLMATGTITVVRADISLPSAMPESVRTLDLSRPGTKTAPPTAAATHLSLGIKVNAPSEIFIRGRGLDAELGGALHVGGSAAAPVITGSIDLRHGTFSLAGTTLNFTSGTIGFDGAHGVDPALNLVASSSTNNVTATLAVGGYASAPKITLSSVPQLPQDQVLAALLFGQSVASLSPLQMAQIGAAVAQLAGIGGNGLNPLEKLRSGLGLDRLSVGSVANAKAGGGQTNTTAAVEGGKYIAPGVFLGAKQGVTGQATQAQLQIDLTKRLKLNTDVGSGPGGNDVGLSYQFQY